MKLWIPVQPTIQRWISYSFIYLKIYNMYIILLYQSITVNNFSAQSSFYLPLKGISMSCNRYCVLGAHNRPGINTENILFKMSSFVFIVTKLFLVLTFTEQVTITQTNRHLQCKLHKGLRDSLGCICTTYIYFIIILHLP